MIEPNSAYTSPVYGCDNQGRFRTWPLPFGPVEPEDINEPQFPTGTWQDELPDPNTFEVLVPPGPWYGGEVGPGA